jgi:hypothetical protein
MEGDELRHFHAILLMLKQAGSVFELLPSDLSTKSESIPIVVWYLLELDRTMLFLLVRFWNQAKWCLETESEKVLNMQGRMRFVAGKENKRVKSYRIDQTTHHTTR